MESRWKVSFFCFQIKSFFRYYPAQPVSCQYGASEALMELYKALDMLGDYTRQGGICRRTWSNHNGGLGGAFIIAAPFENVNTLEVHPLTF